MTPLPAPLAYAEEEPAPEAAPQHAFLYAGSLGFIAVVAPALGILVAGVAVWWIFAPTPAETVLPPQVSGSVVVVPVPEEPVASTEVATLGPTSAETPSPKLVVNREVKAPDLRPKVTAPAGEPGTAGLDEVFIEVHGHEAVELRKGSLKYPLPGKVPAGGMYQLYADTGDGMAPRANFAVGGGTRIRLKCQSDPFVCTDQVVP